jgi:myo-inositol 2-dehydrogenase/D-chiro-inositol 1-dehydrogenase
MRQPLKLCVIGSGTHSLTCHLPALAHYRENHPGRIVLAGIADRIRAKASAAAEKFSIGQAYADVDEMLSREQPAACLAITPVSLNATVAAKLMRLGIPLLMEKPLGATIAEAREVVRMVAETKARVMVSMNRRFDPQVRSAHAWIDGREVQYLRATMARYNRDEERFIEETGVHIVDVIRMIMGEVRSWSTRRHVAGGSHWLQLHLEFAKGGYGLVDLLPTTGSNLEVLEIFGADFSVEIRSAIHDRGWRAWSAGKLVREDRTTAGVPEFISNGTYAETEAFIGNLLAQETLQPTPEDVLPAMEICHSTAIAESAIGASQIA